MLCQDFGHGVLLFVVIIVFHVIAGFGLDSLPFNVTLDFLSNGHFTGRLADFCQISSGKFVCLGGHVRQINVLRNWRLSQSGSKNGETRFKIWHGNVDQLIQTSRTHQRGIDNVGSVGSTDNKDILLCTHSVHFCQKLVHDTIGSTTTISGRSSTLLGDGIQFIEKQDTRSGLSGLFKDITNIRLGFSKPHCQEFRSLDRNKVCLTFVGNSLCHERLTATGRSVEQDTLAWAHTELFEFFGMLHGVLDQFFQVALDSFQTTNIVPRSVRNFDNRFSQTGWVGLRKGMAEVILIDSHAIQDFGIDLLVLNVDQVHLFADALHGSLGTEGGNVGTDKTVCFPGHGFRVNVLVELHVTGVDAEDFEASIFIGDTDIDFAIETTETTKGGVNGIGTVGTSNDNDRRTLLEAVHECQHLTDDTALDFSVGLFTLGGDRVDFINENNGGGILFGLFESLAKVRFGFTSHLGHDFGSIDQKEKGTRFVCNGTRNKGLSTSGWSIQQDSTGWLDSKSLEKSGVTKGKFNHFTDLCHLLAASTNIIVTNIIHLFFVFTLHWISLAVNDSVGGHDTVGRGIRFHDFEFDGMHGRTNQKEISLFDRTVGLQKIRLQINLKEISGNSLNGVVQRQDVDALPVGNIATGRDGNDVGQTDSQVLSDHLVHANVGVVAGFVRQDNANGIASLLSLDQDGVATKELELFHLGGTQANDRVVVVGSIVDNQPIGTALFAAGTEDCVFHFCVFAHRVARYFHVDSVLDSVVLLFVCSFPIELEKYLLIWKAQAIV
mmetsp:Transcript_1727/g.4031  ORF Transcript_1727/g.4031 Transcript_1727/m.4031 type:complete len:777 (+) Transcript_1727:352-2682(+)